MNKKIILFFVFIFFVSLIIYFFTLKNNENKIIKNTIIEGDYYISENDILYIENNSLFQVNGKLDIKGKIKGSEGLRIVAKEGLEMYSSSEILSENGDIYIVSDSSLFPKNILDLNKKSAIKIQPNLLKINKAQAQENSSFDFVFSGKISTANNKGGAKKSGDVHINLGRKSGIIKNASLTTRDGLSAPNTEKESCDVVAGGGGNGGNLTLSFIYENFEKSGSLEIKDSSIVIGGGGKGGSATALCGEKKPAKAKAGDGGASGRLYLNSKTKITGSLKVVLKGGGDGGNADARALNGGAKEKGQDAIAIAGRGGEAVVLLTGANDKIEFEFGKSGNGGSAKAKAGDGGSALVCGENGADGGVAKATAGEAGALAYVDMYISDSYYASKADIYAKDGEGKEYKGVLGFASSYGGKGGNGGSCDSDKKGGDGGYGGNAYSIVNVKEEIAGSGGDGGDGCGPGVGGEPGMPIGPTSLRGEPGEYLCEDKNASVSELCIIPDDVINQAYPKDVYEKIEKDKNGKRILEFKRDACASKSESSVRRGAEAFMPDFKEFCPNAKVSDISFSGLGKPCSVSISLD